MFLKIRRRSLLNKLRQIASSPPPIHHPPPQIFKLDIFLLCLSHRLPPLPVSPYAAHHPPPQIAARQFSVLLRSPITSSPYSSDLKSPRPLPVSPGIVTSARGLKHHAKGTPLLIVFAIRRVAAACLSCQPLQIGRDSVHHLEAIRHRLHRRRDLSHRSSAVGRPFLFAAARLHPPPPPPSSLLLSSGVDYLHDFRWVQKSIFFYVDSNF